MPRKSKKDPTKNVRRRFRRQVLTTMAQEIVSEKAKETKAKKADS